MKQCTMIGKTAVVALCAAGMLSLLAAQKSNEAEPAAEEIDTKVVTRVTLGSGQGTPGTSVVVPIYFAPASGTEIGRLKINVSFISENLKFASLERGIAAETGAVEMKTSLQTAKNDKNLEVSTLTIEANTPGPGKSAIPAGLLGYLQMKINETGRPAKIAIHAQAAANVSGSGQAAANVRGFDGHVEVFAPGDMPAVNCFFFTH